jgi:hypothetical protein
MFTEKPFIKKFSGNAFMIKNTLDEEIIIEKLENDNNKRNNKVNI